MRAKGDIPGTPTEPDMTIVKVEHGGGSMGADTTGALSMFVTEGGVNMAANQGLRSGEEEEQSDYELEEPPGDTTREGGHV